MTPYVPRPRLHPFLVRVDTVAPRKPRTRKPGDGSGKITSGAGPQGGKIVIQES